MLFFGALFVLFPKIILRPFTGGNASAQLVGIEHTVVVLLRFIALYTFFDGMQLVFAFAIRGAGDTRFPFYYTLVSGMVEAGVAYLADRPHRTRRSLRLLDRLLDLHLPVGNGLLPGGSSTANGRR